MKSEQSLAPMIPQLWRVTGTRRESSDTATLAIEPSGADRNFSFAPGQFNMLYVFGIGEVPISMSGDPALVPRLAHTVRGVGPISQAIAEVKKGTTLGLRGPFGSCWPVQSAVGGDVVIVAGGIGLAPLKPALYSIIAQRRAYRRVAVVYGARTPADLLYVKELQRWRTRFDLQVEITVDSGPRGWQGHVGVVTTLLAHVAWESDHTTAMVCGPEIMMRYAVRELQKRGTPDERIFLSLERNMKCAVGFCGHCQFGPTFICKQGPVLAYDRIKPWFEMREI